MKSLDESLDDETYLGDGLYASFDGFMIRLRAPRGPVDHEVYLEPEVLKTLMGFAKDIYKEEWQRLLP